MTNQSVRVQMSPQSKQVLENLATEYGCLYGGKPHISGLLAQIADGRLTIGKKTLSSSVPSHIPLLKLRVWLPVGLRGSFAQIAQRIAYFGGNIFKATVDTNVEQVIVDILFSMPESSNLSDFLHALQQIKIKDVAPFNSSEEILAAISQTKAILHRSEESESDLKVEKRSVEARLAAQVTHRKLLLDISCTIGIRLISKNQSGVLAKVVNEIAEQGFFLSLIQQNFNPEEQTDTIDLLLTLEPLTSSKMSQEMDKIKTIETTLKKIPAIQDVWRLGMDNLWDIHVAKC
ncbi:MULTISPECIES: hypothetical protein [unclassified Microcoleus]|uniref:hypothetical protein n=1 Tax=unclassified Microcoleus TaxID=2642155 RepID=UPI001D9A6507|nr:MULTISPECIES: hypothetical protein [unclassified Microcoleus]MCC3600082.1 hypothetical protein [Microcoleus sp. PH2017_26_ELK_O_A]MCC3625062.1 hypothetical protein [Microcoleus sp. PH2017_36_ELK_O_B]